MSCYSIVVSVGRKWKWTCIWMHFDLFSCYNKLQALLLKCSNLNDDAKLMFIFQVLLFRSAMSNTYNVIICLYFDNLKFDIFDVMVFSASSLILYYALVYFHVSTDISLYNWFPVFWFLPMCSCALNWFLITLVPWALNCLWHHSLELIIISLSIFDCFQ